MYLKKDHAGVSNNKVINNGNWVNRVINKEMVRVEFVHPFDLKITYEMGK